MVEEIVEEIIEEQQVDYSKMKVSELKKECKKREMKGYCKCKKAGLILKLQEDDSK